MMTWCHDESNDDGSMMTVSIKDYNSFRYSMNWNSAQKELYWIWSCDHSFTRAPVHDCQDDNRAVLTCICPFWLVLECFFLVSQVDSITWQKLVIFILVFIFMFIFQGYVFKVSGFKGLCFEYVFSSSACRQKAKTMRKSVLHWKQSHVNATLKIS